MRNPEFDEGIRWLTQAEEDLKWAKHLALEGGFHIACFLAQQVAEKALKAFLYARGEEIVLGHSIVRLCVSAVAYQVDFSEKSNRWGILDSFYIPTRYPNGLPESIPAEVYTQEIAQKAVDLADEVVEFVKQRLV